jgi:dihydrofolate reductase
MRKVILQMLVSLDGFFEGPQKEIDWHNVDDEFNEYAIGLLDQVDTLLFGRTTYKLMADYWPTAQALKNDPVVAGRMNSLNKIVFSTTLQAAPWSNTRLVKTGVAEELAALKRLPGKDIAIFGSSDLALTFLRNGLIDELQILVNPIVLGKGKSLFRGIDSRLKLKLKHTRAFRSGNVLLVYEPEKPERAPTGAV